MPSRNQITITEDLLADATATLGMDPKLAPILWSELDARAPRPRFNAPNVAFYMGATIVIAAMTWFTTSAWDTTGGAFKLGVALVYAAVFGICGYWLRARGMRIPSGLLFTAAVCMTPLAVFGFESATHFWTQADPGAYSGFYEWIKGSWVPMEVATIAVGLVAIRFVRFPFLVAPVGFATWYLSMDLAGFFSHSASRDFDWIERSNVSLAVGLATLIAALWIDRLTREDYAFWLYLFGSMSFWGGIWMRADSNNEFGQFATLIVGLLFIALSLVLGRRVLTVFGSLGCLGYLGHLAWDFRDSLSFPVALTIVGLCVIGLGIWFQANLPRIEAELNAAVPDSVRKLIPRSRVA
jgi:hypothetical protein